MNEINIRTADTVMKSCWLSIRYQITFNFSSDYVKAGVKGYLKAQAKLVQKVKMFVYYLEIKMFPVKGIILHTTTAPTQNSLDTQAIQLP